MKVLQPKLVEEILTQPITIKIRKLVEEKFLACGVKMVKAIKWKLTITIKRLKKGLKMVEMVIFYTGRCQSNERIIAAYGWAAARRGLQNWYLNR